MPVTDPIADLLTRMRNAQHARYDVCRCPWSRHKEEVCAVLKREGYISDVTVEGEGIAKHIVITFDSAKSSLDLKRVSRPGRRMYEGKDGLKPVLRGLGTAIVSTSQGVMTDEEARKKGIGGEVLCTVS